MSHHIYQTKAFVIDSIDTGEGNKFISLFTADLGFIYAAAQGVRLMKSKLRPSIQDMSFSKISLVRGKEMWKVTYAEKLISLYDRRIPLSLRKLMAETFAFLKRLAQGESKHEELFTALSKFCDFILKNTSFSAKHAETLELIAKINILHELGYGSDEGGIKEFSSLAVNALTEDLVLKAEIEEASLRKHIVSALHSSHL